MANVANVARLNSMYQQHELHSIEQTDRLNEQQVDSDWEALSTLNISSDGEELPTTAFRVAGGVSSMVS